MAGILAVRAIHCSPMATFRTSVRRLAPVIVIVGIAALVACGGDDADSGPGDTPTLTVTNETPCIVHVRFDNGYPKFRVLPGGTHEFTDPALTDYSYIKVESTQAIFHTYDMEPVRADGYRLVVRPGYEDDPCVEQ